MGALNLIYTNYPDQGHHGRLPFQGKTDMVQPGIEPGTSWLVVRNSDHQATWLVLSENVKIKIYRTIILHIICMGMKPGICH